MWTTCLWTDIKRNHCVKCDELGRIGLLERLEELSVDRKRLMAEIEARREKEREWEEDVVIEEDEEELEEDQIDEELLRLLNEG